MSLSKMQSKEINNRSDSLNMSSNKRLCLRSDSQNKDSFDERICDDLSEVILQFLPLEDTLKLECVSKQFQRTIFVKVNEIELCGDLYWHKSNQTIIKLMETLIKKCENINRIEMYNGQGYTKLEYNKTIELIIENCNYLTLIGIDFKLISNTILKKFLQKYGSKVMIQNYDVNKISAETREMIMATLGTFSVETFRVGPPFEVLSELKFTRLDGLLIKDFHKSTEDLDQLEVFIEDNKHFIKHLHIECNQIEDYLISKFDNLVLLNLRNLKNGLSDKQWKQIVVNCSQIKTIFCDLLIDPNIGDINDKLMAPFRRFKSLKCLEIDFRYEKKTQIIKDYIKTFSFKAFKGCERLTYLYLYCRCAKKEIISEDILTDIDINLPNIQILYLCSNKIMATEWTADILCRLSGLQQISLSIEKSVRPLIRSRLEKCKLIQRIEVK